MWLDIIASATDEEGSARAVRLVPVRPPVAGLKVLLETEVQEAFIE